MSEMCVKLKAVEYLEPGMSETESRVTDLSTERLMLCANDIKRAVLS